MIIRTFHPIGQGAFYSERHKNFNIVYDCGEWKDSKLADKVVKQSFKSTEVIDILFISHFDADHVNKIIILKNHCAKIRNVVLPLLNDEEKIFLLNYYKVFSLKFLVELIENPQDFFGNETKIIFIKSSENPEIQGEEIDIDNIKLTGLKSNNLVLTSKTIFFSKVIDWVYIPFNYEYKIRHTELEDLFKKNGLDIDKFKNDLDYAILNRRKAKEIYNKVSGKINQNSMLLYSGPRTNKYKTVDSFYQPYGRNIDNKTGRISCIYTGDSDFNILNIKVVFGKYWNNVGTIQIPHHGDIKCFHNSFLDSGLYICPVSVGKTNTFGHPSNYVIGEILKAKSHPVVVSEDINTLLIQTIS